MKNVTIPLSLLENLNDDLDVLVSAGRVAIERKLAEEKPKQTFIIRKKETPPNSDLSDPVAAFQAALRSVTEEPSRSASER